MTELSKAGREPFFYCEIDLDSCALTYGVGACTATGSAGAECYNTFATCQDQDNFDLTSKTYRFSTSEVKNPVGFDAFPVIQKKPQITPARLEVENGIGQRGAVSITLAEFTHNDQGVDPYAATRINPVSGTFFNRLRRRNPFYQKRPFRLVSGYILDGAIVETTTRLYLIHTFDGADKKGNFKITAKDLLMLVDDKSSLFPPPVDLVLVTAMTTGSTTAVLRTGDGSKIDLTRLGNCFLIDDEIFNVSSITTDTLNVLARGINGVTQVHDADSVVSHVGLVWDTSGVNVVDVIYRLLTDFAGIDPAYIPYNDNPGSPDEWDDEKANWLSANNFNNLIVEPTPVKELIKQLSIQNALSLWWNEKEQKIKMSATAIELANQTPPILTDDANIIADSLTIKEDIENVLSQVWIYHEIIDEAKSITDPKNYSSISITVNQDIERAEVYGTPRIKKIYGNWLDVNAASVIQTIASRLLTKDLSQNYKITFSLDAKDAALWTGEHAVLYHQDIQNINGTPEAQKIHITQVKENEPGHKFDYTATTSIYEPDARSFFIADNAVGDYSTASESEKLVNGFISDGDNNFADGGKPYGITG